MGMVALAALLTLCCVIAGGELLLRETLSSSREAQIYQYRGYFF